MENIQILKYCPWITEEIDVKQYFDKYNKILDEVNGGKPHNEEINKEEALREFFHMPDDLEAPFSRRSTPALSLGTRTNSIDSCEGSLSKVSNVLRRGTARPSDNVSADEKVRSKSANDIEDECDAAGDIDSLNDPFAVKKLEEDCSIDLLTVDGELPPRDFCESGSVGDTGRLTNWYAGSFMDGVIPEGGTEKLVTLSMQAKELYKRETVKDYTRLRHRLLKYTSTVRMVMRKENSPENVTSENDPPKSCLRDLVFNIRVQRPFHKKSYHKKGTNRYPKHSQEMYMLGSQKLTDLRDAIICINDAYIHEDMSENPNPAHYKLSPCSEDLFQSAFFYINGVFYSDMRNPEAMDNSDFIRTWAKKYPLIGDMKMFKMEETSLRDLKLRLGYPYVYQHLGNCEHLITFTDVRLHHFTDNDNPARYPLSRGNPIKLSISCFACNLYLANWILKDDARIPAPYAHLCDQCLKLLCFDDNGKKISDFKLYPFSDEFAAIANKEQRERMANNVHITIDDPSGSSSQLIIKPFVE